MATYLLIDDAAGVIVNRIEAGPEYVPPQGQSIVLATPDNDGDIGWKWDGQKGVDPTPPPPNAANTPKGGMTVL